MKAYLRLETLRTLRDPLYLCLAIAAPIGFYLLFSGLFGSSPHAPGTLPGNVQIMIPLAVYGGIWACLVATGPHIASERSGGWLRYLSLLPIAPWKIVVGRALVAIMLAAPAMLLVYGTGVVARGVRLSAEEWALTILLTWVGVWPFALVGIILGYVTTETTTFGVTYGFFTALTTVGGLTIPPAIMPGAMFSIAKVLPTYHAANLGWRVANGQPVTLTSVVNLLVWTVIFLALVALIAARPWRMRLARIGASRAAQIA